MSGLSIANGWFVHRGRAVWGYGKASGLWRLQYERSSLIRNMPGEVCQGRTEDLDALTDNMAACAYPVWYHFPGLWYDRRRDTHETHQQPDGNHRPPFLEMPWARSDRPGAWDGGCKYDLSRFNDGYFDRLRGFAERAERKGLVLLHNFYQQHCITFGSHSHYVDYPWRPVNCIQDVAMPPDPGDGVANAFYDVTNDLHADLHRRYIHRCLDALGEFSCVVHLIGDEYSGPAAFLRFWMDRIIEWEQCTGHQTHIGLKGTRDVMDDILAEPARADRIDVLDLSGWGYDTEGERFSHPGGQEVHGGRGPATTPNALYRQITEVRSVHPDKALIKLLQPEGPATANVLRLQALACLCGGGAIPIAGIVNHGPDYVPPPLTLPLQPLYDMLRTELGDVLPRMRPVDGIIEIVRPPHEGWRKYTCTPWTLADGNTRYLAILPDGYGRQGFTVRVHLPGNVNDYRGRWFDLNSGRFRPADLTTDMHPPSDMPVCLILEKVTLT